VTFADRIGNAQRGIGPLHRTRNGESSPAQGLALNLYIEPEENQPCVSNHQIGPACHHLSPLRNLLESAHRILLRHSTDEAYHLARTNGLAVTGSRSMKPSTVRHFDSFRLHDPCWISKDAYYSRRNFPLEISRNALFAALKRGSSSRLLWALLLAIMLLVAMFLLGWLNAGEQMESRLQVTGGRGASSCTGRRTVRVRRLSLNGKESTEQA